MIYIIAISFYFIIIVLLLVVVSNKTEVIIFISSCNRFYYLNITLHSIISHMNLYESLVYKIIIVDQGTIELRENNKNIYNIYNIFYLNPNGYIYTYNIIFSYLYSKYVVLIDDDRPIRNDVEINSIYPNFLKLCMRIMDYESDIYGFVLKREGDGKVKCYNKKKVVYCKIIKGFLGYYYSNGASIYKSKVLKLVDEYKGEKKVANFISKTNFRMAFIILKLLCKNYSNSCNYFFDHIGKNSSLKNIKICSNFLY